MACELRLNVLIDPKELRQEFLSNLALNSTETWTFYYAPEFYRGVFKKALTKTGLKKL
jgi:hypothetical protein